MCGMGDLGSCNLPPERIFDPHGEAGIGGRIRRLGMDDFSAVVGEFNGLGKADLRQRGGVRTDARIGREHTVNIVPSPYLVAAGRCPTAGAWVLRAPAPQGRGLPPPIGSAVT